MRIRVCRSKNAGVAGYAEAFRPVQSDSQASEWYSYFENDVLVSVEPLSIQTGEASIPASFTGKRYRNMEYNKVWTAQVAGATIMPGVRACGQEWKQNCYMIVMIQRKWLRMNLRQSFGDISPVTGITGGSAPLIEVFPQWSKDNNITLPWRKQHRVQKPWGKCVN